MTFQNFCLSKTTRIPFEDQDCGTLDTKYERILDVTIKDLSKKREIFDRVNVTYVENAVDIEDLGEVLAEKLPDGDVPFPVIKELSHGIFKKNPHELNVEQQSIIKILSIYICISI